MGAIPYRSPSGDSRADEVGKLVRKIAENRRALLPHRRVFTNLERVVKDPWMTGPIELNDRGLVEELPPEETIAVRLDQELEVVLSERVRARVDRVSPTALRLRRGRREIGRVTGGPARLDLLEHVLAGTADESVDETLLPKDLALFALRREERQKLVDELLSEGRKLVEEVERLVCDVYDVPDELTEDVIAHAVARGTPGSE